MQIRATPTLTRPRASQNQSSNKPRLAQQSVSPSSSPFGRNRPKPLPAFSAGTENSYGTLHGGAVASVAEIMSIACARTIVGEDKELFLGELSTTYLSAAPRNAELTVDASVIRSGRSLTVIAVEFKVKDTGKLVYTSHATFYNTPVASL